jgi:hypothetical protein
VAAEATTSSNDGAHRRPVRRVETKPSWKRKDPMIALHLLQVKDGRAWFSCGARVIAVPVGKTEAAELRGREGQVFRVVVEEVAEERNHEDSDAHPAC